MKTAELVVVGRARSTAAVPEVLKVFGQRLGRVDAGHVGQNEAAQFGIFDQQRLLQRRDAAVVQLGHVLIGQRVARLVVDLEARVKLEHVQQLQNHKQTKKTRFHSFPRRQINNLEQPTVRR